MTTGDLRRLATVDPGSLFRDADSLADTSEGIMIVPWRIVTATMEGRTRFTSFRLLYTRDQFTDDGVIIGKKPRTTDGIDLDDRLAVIAAGINASASDHEEADHAS
jgi:hypothetical protein